MHSTLSTLLSNKRQSSAPTRAPNCPSFPLLVPYVIQSCDPSLSTSSQNPNTRDQLQITSQLHSSAQVSATFYSALEVFRDYQVAAESFVVVLKLRVNTAKLVPTPQKRALSINNLKSPTPSSIMSSYYHFNAHQQHPAPATAAAVQHAHHGGRNRRHPRLSVSQNAQKQFRGVRSMKELTETAHNLSDYRTKFEATRSFELEDDFDFIPNLLTDSDVSFLRSRCCKPTWRA